MKLTNEHEWIDSGRQLMQDVESGATLAGAALSIAGSDLVPARSKGGPCPGMTHGVGDLTGGYLSFVNTGNAARVGDIAAWLLGTDLAGCADLGVRDRRRRFPRLGVRRRGDTLLAVADRRRCDRMRCAAAYHAEATVVERALLGSPQTDSYEREPI